MSGFVVSGIPTLIPFSSPTHAQFADRLTPPWHGVRWHQGLRRNAPGRDCSVPVSKSVEGKSPLGRTLTPAGLNLSAHPIHFAGTSPVITTGGQGLNQVPSEAYPRVDRRTRDERIAQEAARQDDR